MSKPSDVWMTGTGVRHEPHNPRLPGHAEIPPRMVRMTAAHTAQRLLIRCIRLRTIWASCGRTPTRNRIHVTRGFGASAPAPQQITRVPAFSGFSPMCDASEEAPP